MGMPAAAGIQVSLPVSAESPVPTNEICSHLRILIHRDSFLTPDDGSEGGQAVTAAACRISRIAEDMYTGGTLRFAQMHL